MKGLEGRFKRPHHKTTIARKGFQLRRYIVSIVAGVTCGLLRTLWTALMRRTYPTVSVYRHGCMLGATFTTLAQVVSAGHRDVTMLYALMIGPRPAL